MSKIRKVYFFDRQNTEEMISLLNNNENDSYINNIMFNPLISLHHLLPLYLKFLPESYVLKDCGEIKGLITIAPIKSRYHKMEIQKLLFEENSLSDAAELVQYVVSKYKAMGSASIVVKVDDYLNDLLTMLTSNCGFSLISSEKLWRVNNFPETEYNEASFRDFKNSDSKHIANIYNDSLLPHFRPLLGKGHEEFQENFFKGLSYYSEYKYTIEDSKNVTGYISIRTSDNENFILDIVQTGWTEPDINAIIHFASDKIKKRKNRFGLFVKSKKYTHTGDKYEEIFTQNGYECVQNRLVLTNSSARVLKNTEKAAKYTVLNSFVPSNGIPT